MGSDKFEDIRAYPRTRFKEIWQQIQKNRHFSQIVFIISRRFSSFAKNIAQVASWEQFRSILYRLIRYFIEKRTGGFTWSGAENIPKTSNKLGAIFISNHRSIVFDPLLFNYLYYEETKDTIYSAIGDNLMTPSWQGDFLRLLGGFVVKRNIKEPETKLNEVHRLSRYIRNITDKGNHVWIAQRSGRAKDGNDQTDSAVLSMLKLAHPDKSWEEFTAEVPIIPVSISYEEIPLDTVIVRDRLGRRKPSDSKFMRREVQQKIRRIHIHISEPVEARKRSELIEKIDSSIIRNMRIWDSNREAYELLNNKGKKLARWFQGKLIFLKPLIRQEILKIYANPYINKLKLKKSR